MSVTPEPEPAMPVPPPGTPRIVIVLIAAAILVTVGAIVTGFVVAVRIGHESSAPQTGPLAVPAAPAPGADGSSCAALMAALPDTLADAPRRPLLVDDAGVAAWGDPAVILRCGIQDPAELTCSATLTTVSDKAGVSVQWLRIAGSDAVTFLAVDRPVRVAVTVPDSAGLAPVQQLTEVIAGALPSRPVCDGGDVVAPDDN